MYSYMLFVYFFLFYVSMSLCSIIFSIIISLIVYSLVLPLHIFLVCVVSSVMGVFISVPLPPVPGV